MNEDINGPCSTSVRKAQAALADKCHDLTYVSCEELDKMALRACPMHEALDGPCNSKVNKAKEEQQRRCP